MTIAAGTGLDTSAGAGVTGVRLVDGDAEMVLLPRTDLTLQQLTVPFPDVREVAEARTDDDGTDDTTARFGARAVSIQVLLRSTPAALVDELRGYLRPSARPWLYVTDAGWEQERRIRLRVDQESTPIGSDLPPEARAALLQWKAPDGVWEAADDVAVTLPLSAVSTTGLTLTDTEGLTITDTDGITIEAGSDPGSARITNVGNTDVHWLARLYGPATGPEFTLDSTGETLLFTSGLVIAAGDYLELNSAERTAYLNGNTDSSRLSYLDFAASTWWKLGPGDNLIRYHPASGTGAATQAVLTYRPAWL